MRLSDMNRTPEVQCHRILERALLLRQIEKSGRIALILEARQAPRLRLVRVDREGFVVASAGMRDVVDAAAERAPVPAIDDYEGQRCMDVDRRLQRRRQLPCLEADTSDVFAGAPGCSERHKSPVAGDGVASGVEALHPNLQPLDRGIDETRGGAGGRVLAENVPGLQRVTQFEHDAAVVDGSVERKTKLALRLKPLLVEMVACSAKTFQHAEEVCPNKVLQHKAVVQRGAPAHQRAALRLAPEPGDQGS